jgi:branched-chain amino acid transport system permease protein
VLVPSYLTLASQIAITALFALSLDLILGYAGIVSLGHAAFFGLGAYSAGLLAKHGWGEPFSGLVVAAAVAGLVGYAMSFIIARFRHLALIMITLGLGLLLAEAANSASWLTGGADGLQGVIMEPLFGRFAFDLDGRTAYAYSLTTLFVLTLLARRFIYSPFGLALMAIRDNPLRAAALGVPVYARTVAAYTLAAAYAGAAGALLAQTSAFVSLDVFDFHRSADVLLVLIIGGAGWLYGGIAGAILYTALQDGLATLTPHYWQFWIGLFLVAFVMIGRERMTGGLRGLAAAVSGRVRR